MQKTAEQIADEVLEKVAGPSTETVREILKRAIGPGARMTEDTFKSLAYHKPRAMSRAAGLPSPFPKAKWLREARALRDMGYSEYGGPEFTAMLRDYDPNIAAELMKKIGL